MKFLKLGWSNQPPPLCRISINQDFIMIVSKNVHVVQVLLIMSNVKKLSLSISYFYQICIYSRDSYLLKPLFLRHNLMITLDLRCIMYVQMFI